MVVKKSANVGPIIERMLSDEELSVNQIAFDLDVSPQMASHLKNNRRTMQQDIAKHSIKVYHDSPEYIGDILHEFSDGYTSPVLRGESIERTRLAMEACAERELTEALNMIRDVCLAKPPGVITAIERESIEKMMDELLDARTFIDNLNMLLEKEYGISIKKRIKGLMPQWKAKGWI